MQRITVVAPGRAYGPQAPLLWYATRAAELRGATIDAVTWRLPEDLSRRGAAAREQVAEALAKHVTAAEGAAAESAAHPVALVIAKSLGCAAAPLAAEHGLPGIWLTPVLTDAAIVDGLARATAPQLLIGGTADTVWDGALARQLSPHVLQVEGADHAMLVPGPLAASAAVLGRVVAAVEHFLDEVLWT